MPAEWEKHSGIWISWPKNRLTFPGNTLQGVEQVYLQMILGLQDSEQVNLLVNDSSWEESIRKKLAEAGIGSRNIKFWQIPSSDVWIRDYCPIFLVNRNENRRALAKWTFNAWGNKYKDIVKDNESGEQIAREMEKTGMEIFRPGIVLEGGSIDVNGKGTLLTTTQCLLNRNRNPELSKEHIEEKLRDYLGVTKIIWLQDGIEGDDTDGHIDDFVRFVGEGRIVCSFEEDKEDRNYGLLKHNIDILEASTDQDGKELEVIKLPMPKGISIPEKRLPASYANFYIGNRVVLLPVFWDPNDLKAIEILGDCFPGRRIVPIMARDLVYGNGGIHCVTMQEPGA